jgi:iron complex outermembrane recepter protein
MKKPILSILFFISFLLIADLAVAQIQKVTGIVKDKNNKQPLGGATVIEKGTTNGTTTDFDGKFSLNIDLSTPKTLVISYIGFASAEIQVSQTKLNIEATIEENIVQGKEVLVQSSRLTEKQKESPLTVESMDLIAIKQTSASNFYEGLGQLKGVDLTSASIGFKIINTRGFNSTSPVRSLQLIDGVDNQSPGLNFSLGNFLGCSEIDIQKVDLIVGASSAFYGPNAFNGVINMTTRSPFTSPGLTVMSKVGERGLFEFAVRHAEVFKNKNGIDKFAYKLNMCYMQANDWEADNMDVTEQSLSDVRNPGGYDAVNIYGDEYDNDNDDSGSPRAFPGLNIRYRTGYKEKDIVDYNTENLKAALGLYYKITNDVEVNYGFSVGTGTTVYQGDNRYSLKDIKFYQNKIEIKKENKFFIRAYETHENAGNSYDAVFTALLLQQKAKSSLNWSGDYRNNWSANGNTFFTNVLNNDPRAPQPPPFDPNDPDYNDKYQAYLAQIQPFLLENYYDSLIYYHNLARNNANNGNLNPSLDRYAYYEPGTSRYDSAFADITSKKSFSEGGSKFFDKSALYHIQGEYKFTTSFMDITVGANMRQYRPNSEGTIFSDTSGRKIKNSEYGSYIGLEKKFLDEKLKINLTTRVDKNENFDYLISPAASAVYTLKENNIFRLSFSSAIRNPTLTDQYLYYNVGRAILLGNIDGMDSLVTIPSLINFLNSQNPDTLSYFNIPPVRPEEVKSIELGYRTTLWKTIFIDASYYFSFYKYFLGYKLGADVHYVDSPAVFVNDVQIYRVAANSNDVVTTQGFAIGATYFFKEFFSLSGNYSWNVLDKRDSQDPIIPAFNTPENKFNIGISGRDIDRYYGPVHIKNWGFSVNYKWIQGFRYEGSPQFTGFVPTYDMLDAQISKTVPSIYTTFKLGASNVLNKKSYQVYGGPKVGRLAYFSLTFDLARK